MHENNLRHCISCCTGQNLYANCFANYILMSDISFQYKPGLDHLVFAQWKMGYKLHVNDVISST